MQWGLADRSDYSMNIMPPVVPADQMKKKTQMIRDSQLGPDVAKTVK